MTNYNDNDDQNLETVDDRAEPEGPKENIAGDKKAEAPVRNFDLNVDLTENGDSTTLLATAPGPASTPAGLSVKTIPKMKHEERPGWSFADVEEMVIDPVQFANLNRRIDEDDEDYNKEN